ncbi:MAG: putative toxin-antitoxin system toxin component, PIN family [Nitrospirae bacterium RBG_16_64_22]|nr:MAG: putative toxin-antitoxin system toxin component, PIN family [Nitrospirae bacterium RBG_16_64_22]
MRVFLDTNVLASAFATRGLCADLVREILAEHDLITGEVVLGELERVLLRTFGVPAGTAASVIALLRTCTVVPRPKKILAVHVRDADDAWVLASAVAAKADVLVTGDKDLLAVGNKAGILITNPRGFWNLLRGA